MGRIINIQDWAFFEKRGVQSLSNCLERGHDAKAFFDDGNENVNPDNRRDLRLTAFSLC